MNQSKNQYRYIFTQYPDVVNIHQMCEMLGGISTKTGYALLKNNQIKSMKIGRTYRIPKIHIFEYLNIALDQKSVNPRSCV